MDIDVDGLPLELEVDILRLWSERCQLGQELRPSERLLPFTGTEECKIVHAKLTDSAEIPTLERFIERSKSIADVLFIAHAAELCPRM